MTHDPDHTPPAYMLASIAAWFVANDALSLSLVETIVAIALIIGFAVVATGWTIRRDV